MAYPDRSSFSNGITTTSLQTSIRNTLTGTTVLATDNTIVCDTTAAGYTVLLPAAPVDGMIVNIKKATTDVNVLTIGRNGKLIEGTAADLTTAATTRPNFQLQYSNTTNWWVL